MWITLLTADNEKADIHHERIQKKVKKTINSS